MTSIGDIGRLILPDRIGGGERRFRCSCGMTSQDPIDGIMHAFAGAEQSHIHGVFIEKFSRGRWFFDHKPLMEKIIERMRRPGETFNDFARRITRELTEANAAMEQMDAEGRA